jgi:hypothetical protein
MIDLLKLSQKHGHHKLQEAIDVGRLERYTRPLPTLHQYDRLLNMGAAQ